MRLDEVITRVRDVLDSTNAQGLWTDVEVTRHINNAVMYMFRWQVQADPSYHNLDLDLTGSSNSTQVHSNVFEYQLPRWVFRVTRVRETKGTTSTVGANFFPGDFGSGHTGFVLDAMHRLRLTGLRRRQRFRL